MSLKDKLEIMQRGSISPKDEVVSSVKRIIEKEGYHVYQIDDARPWGGFFRLENSDADRFIREFFPGLDPVEARLGNAAAELSPKILLVAPGQRLSWQYHDRRAERWAFLTTGGYHKSLTDDQGDEVIAGPGDIVQFARGERHRLTGAKDGYTFVAEIWQHVDPQELSEEDDIVRLSDDYKR